MRSLKWVKAAIAMAAFVGVGYVTACAGDPDTKGVEERVGEVEQEYVGGPCNVIIGGGYWCPGPFFAYQSVTCCTEGANHICRDVYNDWSNCGSCGHSCNDLGQWCRGGTCCGTFFGVHTADCDHNGTCETSLLGNSNCGYCGVQCTGGKQCTNYSCQCPSGQTDCSGTCYNLQTNPAHCGSCTNACSVAHGTAGCSGGTCTIASCTAPYRNCDGQYANGCETNTSNDPNNCGVCGHVCSSGQCVNGACVCNDSSDCSGLGLAQAGCCDPGSGTKVCTELNDPCNCGSCNTKITDAAYHAPDGFCKARCCLVNGLAQYSCMVTPYCNGGPTDLLWCPN